MSIVVDCSAFGPIILTDESSDILPGLRDALEAGQALVPVHWHVEIASAVQSAIRRGRLPPGAETDAAATVAALTVSVDAETSNRLWSEAWTLADRHRLTIYDSAYLELALRTRSPLATHDTALIRAALAETVTLFGR